MSFLQERGLVWILFLALASSAAWAAYSGEIAGMTARQREIMAELENYVPPRGGVGVRGWLMQPWEADKGLEELVALPEGVENAAACFARLEEYYPQEKEALEHDGSDSRGVDELLRAADMGRCSLSPEYYPVFNSTQVKQPALEVLQAYLQALLRRAEKAMQAGRPGEAERCFRAALVCGRHLLNDASSCLVYATGLLYSVRGAQGYAGFLLRSGDRVKAETAKRFARTIGELLRAFTWKTNVALSEVNGFACLPSAIRIATGDSEAFWRKEAVVRLAALRYGVTREKDGYVERNPLFELAADETLTLIVRTDPDESVRRLAVWSALNVSPKGYALLEHRFDK